MKILYNYLMFSFFLLAILFSNFANGQTENRGARLSDNTVGKANSNQGLHEFAILDLESFEKGFLLPRMTTSQRDAINVESQSAGGLVIFNTTTDCVNYYNQGTKAWASLCGDMLPGNLTILPEQCSNMKILGNFYEGRELDGSNGILLDLSVSKAGLYDVVASTENGYLFHAKGVFPNTGKYQVFLVGEGKPKVGHKRNLTTGAQIDKGDLLTIKINGEKSTCVDKFVFVESPMPKFTIDSAVANGTYMNGVPTEASNTMTLSVNVSKGGRLIFYSQLVNGVEFVGEKIVTNPGTTTVVLKAKGTPDKNGIIPIVIYGNSEHIVGDQAASINGEFTVAPVKYSILNCASITPKGTAEVGKPLDNTNYLDVTVKVEASGLVNLIATNTQNSQGIRFESGQVMLKYTKGGANEQIIRLIAKSGVPNTEPSVDLSFSGTGLVGTCKVKLPVKPQPVNLTLSGTPKLVTGKFVSDSKSYVTPRTKMPDTGSTEFTIETTIRANSIGKYKVSTDVINGVWFSAEGTLTENDIGSSKKIVLKAYGESLTDLPTVTYTLKTNSTVNHNDSQTVKVDFVYRSMTIYSIGGGAAFSWHLAGYNGDNGWFAGPRLVRTLKNFGWDGIVRIAKLNFVGLADPQKTGAGVDNAIVVNGGAVNSTFRTNLRKSDIVVLGAYSVGSTLTIGEGAMKEMKAFAEGTQGVNGKKGVVVYADSDKEQFSSFVNLFVKEKYPSENAKIVNSLNNTSQMLSNPLPETELIFGKKGTYFTQAYNDVGPNGLYGKIVGGNKAVEYEEVLSSLFIPIAKRSENSTFAFIFMHKDLGVLFAGSSFIFGGVTTNNSTVVGDFPLYASMEGKPLVRKTTSGSFKGKEIYNSWLLLNTIHWAIDYAQRNQPNVPN